jgi:hypothetical protein
LYVEIIMIDDAFRTPFLARRFMIKIYCMWMIKIHYVLMIRFIEYE